MLVHVTVQGTIDIDGESLPLEELSKREAQGGQIIIYLL